MATCVPSANVCVGVASLWSCWLASPVCRCLRRGGHTERGRVLPTGSGAPDLISVLTPEEQMELAMRLSQPSRTPTALGTSSPQPSRSTSAHRMSPPPKPKQEGLRLIVIDGCNVAMAHGLHRTFSVRGLCLAYEYFRERGHQV